MRFLPDRPSDNRSGLSAETATRVAVTSFGREYVLSILPLLRVVSRMSTRNQILQVREDLTC